jgi:condensin complex subunit 2
MFYGSGLVAEPAKVAKISINYTKVAKKVDVKALKTAIWDDLCDDPPTSTTQKEKEKEKEQDEFIGERNFQSMLSSVEGRVGKDVGEVSVALCFICVLHLCNEKGLSLSQEGIEDLHISSKPT